MWSLHNQTFDLIPLNKSNPESNIRHKHAIGLFSYHVSYRKKKTVCFNTAVKQVVFPLW